MCGTPVLYFEDAEIPEEVMRAAVSCKDETDMSEKAKEMLMDGRLMNKLITEGLEFTRVLGNDFREKTMDVYSSLLKNE
jgi:hypothetical protein